MNKKNLAIIAAILILCSLIFCGCEVNINLPENPSENSSENISSESEPNSAPEESEPAYENNENLDSYEDLINVLHDTESAFGEAFIGYIEGPMGTGYEEFFAERGYLEKYPFIADIPYERYVETDGNEMYCIVPRDKNSSVSVNEWIYSPTGGTYGKVLYRSESGEPIIITCNKNSNIPNVKVVIVDSEGNVFEFSPYFNSQLGWLEVYETPEAHSYDFTVYEDSAMDDILVFDDLIGDWTAWYSPYGDYTLAIHMTIYEGAAGEQCITYWYGEEEGEMLRYYEGYLFDELYEDGTKGSNLIFAGTLTQGTESAEVGPINISMTLEFRMSDYDTDCIIVSRFGGDHFISGEEHIGFLEFTRAYG